VTLGQPIYFGPSDRARFGFLHWPSSPVRGAAVICPPLGYEAVCAHTTLRHLAEGLAGKGIVTLRIDYDGTGNSVGADTDPDRVAAWQSSVHDAVTQLRLWQLPSVTLVGLRFGATLAAKASTCPGVGGLVLWDPILSGRRYARAMRLFSATGAQGTVDDGITVGGIVFSAATLTELAAVRVTHDDITVPSLLVLRAEGETEAHALADGDHPVPMHVRSLAGTSELVEVNAELAQVPSPILHEITGWVERQTLGEIRPAPRRPSCVTGAVEDRDGMRLRHSAMRIGSGRLFAVETVRDGTEPRRAVVMLNNGVARSIGPGRAWVDFGATLAARGARVLRLDLGGLGDSPARSGHLENDTYPLTVADDVGAAVAYLRSIGVTSIALLGLCSGGFASFDAAVVHPEIDAVMSINGGFITQFNDRRRDRSRRAAGQTLRPLRIPLHKTPLQPVFAKIPTWVWQGLDRTHLVASPVTALERAVTRGVRILLVFGPDEYGLTALRVRGGRRFDALLADPLVTLTLVPGLEHSMFDREGRCAVQAIACDYLERLDGPAPLPVDRRF
jgi:pimeloyl-ACP methyl ester carboxylesterase